MNHYSWIDFPNTYPSFDYGTNHSNIWDGTIVFPQVLQRSLDFPFIIAWQSTEFYHSSQGWSQNTYPFAILPPTPLKKLFQKKSEIQNSPIWSQFRHFIYIYISGMMIPHWERIRLVTVVRIVFGGFRYLHPNGRTAVLSVLRETQRTPHMVTMTEK